MFSSRFINIKNCLQTQKFINYTRYPCIINKRLVKFYSSKNIQNNKIVNNTTATVQSLSNNSKTIVKNEKLLKFLLKSKTIAKMYKNPKYDRFFNDLLQSNTSTIFVTFMVLHELTAIIPLFLIWYLVYDNWSKIDKYYENIMNKFAVENKEIATVEENRSSSKNLEQIENEYHMQKHNDNEVENYLSEKCHDKLVHFHKVFAKLSKKYFMKNKDENGNTELSPKKLKEEIEKLRKLTFSGATSYVVIKIIAPLRIMFSIYYTPSLANFIQTTILNSIKNVFKKI